jgi:hypothetical protein
MKKVGIVLTVALGATSFASASAAAQEAKVNEVRHAEMPSRNLTTGPFGTTAVNETVLRDSSGREDTNQLTQATLRAGVSQNSVGNNSVTGNARIEGNAFQNMSGLSILNVNTGNNVAINAAMNVNVSLSPAP